MIGTTVTIGDIPVRLWSRDRSFSRLVRKRYANFVRSCSSDSAELIISLSPGHSPQADQELKVFYRDGTWYIQRGDFSAEWDMLSRRGTVSQPRSPYALDSLLRILHTLILAQQGGFLLHAASIIRHGRAFIFAGQSGAGKTTMCRLAPPDSVLLSDEISFVRPAAFGYYAFGTPFYGELAVPGKNTSAPLSAVYLLEHATENQIEELPSRLALTQFLRNVLLFAHDPETVGQVFSSALQLISRVPVRRLRFAPTPRVWETLEQVVCS